MTLAVVTGSFQYSCMMFAPRTINSPVCPLGKRLPCRSSSQSSQWHWRSRPRELAILGLLDSNYVGPVNIGNPNEFTILELAEAVIDVTKSSSKIVFEPLPVDDPTQRQPDITLAKSLCGWEPQIQLREGLERTFEWYQSEVEAHGG